MAVSLVLHRGALGSSWRVDDGWLAPWSGEEPSEHAPGAAPQALDCAWDARVELRPGAVNAHTHLYSGLAPLGLPSPHPPPRSFLEILERVWWRLDRALDERTLRAAARYALAHALLSGCTTLLDHHESPRLIEGSLDVLADEAQALGVRVVVGYGATERNLGRAEGRRGLAECERFLRSNRRPLVRGLVALHASFTASDETLREAGALARSLGVGVHVHLAEDGADVDDARRRGYAGPLERLLALDALPPGSVLAHGVHLSEAQVARADAAGLWLVQNPRSNESNCVGYAHALSASAHVALGTDGWPADLALERAALLRLGQSHGDDAPVLERRVTAAWRLAGALFGDAHFGPGLEPGGVADLVVGLPGERPRHVLVGGRAVVVNGELRTADLEEIDARAREAAPALWARMGAVDAPPPLPSGASS
jgi:cytosine/adenosine deaminase-related metal-dependent hydrolase